MMKQKNIVDSRQLQEIKILQPAKHDRSGTHTNFTDSIKILISNFKHIIMNLIILCRRVEDTE